jgi:hypothetical protein
MRRTRGRAMTIGLGALGIALAGCGGGGGETAAPPPVTVTATVIATPTPTPTVEATGRVTPPKVERGVVPDVVGMNHQLAQDTMQAAGFYNLSEEDASGRDRALIVDRNWIVVEQQPKGGTKASADVTVILRSKHVAD